MEPLSRRPPGKARPGHLGAGIGADGPEAPLRAATTEPAPRQGLSLVTAVSRLARRTRRAATTGLLACAVVCGGAMPSLAREPLIFLLPAPPQLPAFAPYVIARQLGYYASAGYDVQFASGRGGSDVAQQVGSGNAPIGSALGDTPILVRANGVPVKDVALMGGGALAVVVARKDRGIARLEDLHGKKVSVMSFQEGNYFALLEALAAKGIAKTAVSIEAVGPGGVVSLVVAGAVDACVCTPDWEVDVRHALPDVVSLTMAADFPAMAQSIVVSDETIAHRPGMVRAIVSGSVRGMQYVMQDPVAAAHVFAEAVPAFGDKQALLVEIFKNYRERTYKGQTSLGAVDPEKLAKVEEAYLRSGRIKFAVPLDELYTNAFVP